MFSKSWNKRFFAPDNEGGAGGPAKDDESKKPVSVSDSVIAAFDAHEKESDSSAGAKPGTAAATNTIPAKEPAAPGTVEGKPAASTPGEGKTNSTTTSQADSIKAPASGEAPIVAPASWDAESKAEFAKLPPALQKVVAKRESDRDGFVSKSGEELATYRKRFDALEQILEPRRNDIARTGMGEAQFVGQLLALAEQANRDFPAFITEQAKLRNFDLKALVAAQGEPTYVDPAIASLQAEVTRLTNHINQGQQQQVQQVQNGIVTQINDFVSEKDAAGNLLRPHYAKLEADIEPFILSIRRGNPNLPTKEVLQQAYDRALWANPEMRGTLIEQERKAAADKMIEEEKARAQKAAGAVVTHRGSPSAGAASATTESVEDTVRNTMAAFGI